LRDCLISQNGIVFLRFLCLTYFKENQINSAVICKTMKFVLEKSENRHFANLRLRIL